MKRIYYWLKEDPDRAAFIIAVFLTVLVAILIKVNKGF